MTWTLSERTEPVARKPHRCDDCGKPIEAGQKYSRLRGKWEGEFTTHLSHMDCRDACYRLCQLHGLWQDEGVILADVEEDDWPLLLEEFPAVAERLGIKPASKSTT